MKEYLDKDKLLENITDDYGKWTSYNDNDDLYRKGVADNYSDTIRLISEMPAADVQEKKYCRMIPLEPDCRSYTDVFICTNCHQHIHLGFIRKEYSGNFCIECGAELESPEPIKG